MAEGRRTTRVGRYELGKTIGEGSFAKVKIARDTRDGSTCAIKVLDRNHVLRHKMVEQVPSLPSRLLPSLFSPFRCSIHWGNLDENLP
jgi:serine/threonine protein kinase